MTFTVTHKIETDVDGFWNAFLDPQLVRAIMDDLKEYAGYDHVEERRDESGNFQRYLWAVEGDYFDLGVIEFDSENGKTKRKLAAAPDEPQMRYEVELYVEAFDTNFDTGPRSSKSEPIPLLVVSDSDLLVEIGKDEQKLGVKLDDALKRLVSARSPFD